MGVAGNTFGQPRLLDAFPAGKRQSERRILTSRALGRLQAALCGGLASWPLWRWLLLSALLRDILRKRPLLLPKLASAAIILCQAPFAPEL